MPRLGSLSSTAIVYRLALLLPLIFALGYDPAYARTTPGATGPLVFVGVLAALVLAGRLLAMRVAAKIGAVELHESVARLARLMGLARTAALLWTGAGLYVLGWGTLVPHVLSSLHLASADLGWAVLVTLPSYLTWVGLYWAQYPADRATREQAMLAHLDAALPVHSTPSLWQYLEHHLRTGPGLILLPVLAVLLTRDIAFLSLRFAGASPAPWLQGVIYLGATALVFVFAPALIVRILHTRRLPDGELRTRLEQLASRSGVRVRELLVWHTGNSAANAMVTGMLPGVRYVVLSDLLLESLADEHIEAVFAHELGHIVHRHMAWYGAFLLSLSIVLGWVGPLRLWAETQLSFSLGGDAVDTVVTLAALLFGFGLLSRRFERQADVYAARAMQAPRDATPAEPPATSEGPEAATPVSGVESDASAAPVAVRVPVPVFEPAVPTYLSLPPLAASVGPRGAMIFVEALTRVAWINNYPIDARNFTHGSMRTRMDALVHLARDPTRTASFDLSMHLLQALLVALLAAGAVTVWYIGIN